MNSEWQDMIPMDSATSRGPGVPVMPGAVHRDPEIVQCGRCLAWVLPADMDDMEVCADCVADW